MGLDWFLEPKEVDGRTVQPAETAGRKFLDKNDPDSVDKFRKIYDEKRATLKDPGAPPTPTPPPPGFGRIAQFFNGVHSRRGSMHRMALHVWDAEKREFDWWNRPFDVVVDEFSKQQPPFVVQHASEECENALARYLGMGDVYDFRADQLREDKNVVTNFAYFEEKKDWPMLIAVEQTPSGMLELADEMEKSLAAYRAAGSRKTYVKAGLDMEDGVEVDAEELEMQIDAVETAIRWLRFWGGKGHSIVADW